MAAAAGGCRPPPASADGRRRFGTSWTSARTTSARWATTTPTRCGSSAHDGRHDPSDRVPGHPAAAALVLPAPHPVVRDAGPHRRTQRRLIETEAFWINFNRETQSPSPIAEDFGRVCWADHRHQPVAVEVLPQGRLPEDAEEIREFPIRVQRYRPVRPRQQLGVLEGGRGVPRPAPGTDRRPLRVTIEHDEPSPTARS